MLAGVLIEVVLGLSDKDAKRQLLSPLLIGKKVEVLRRCLDRIERDDIRALARNFCDEISSLNSGRNHAIHGFWGWETSENGAPPRAAAHSHKSKKPFYAEEISGVADRIAAATIRGHQTLMMLGGTPRDSSKYPVTFWFGPVPPFDDKVDMYDAIGGEAKVRNTAPKTDGHRGG